MSNATMEGRRLYTRRGTMSPDIRKTHPNLYWIVMILGVMQVALAFNFFILSPTFPIYAAPNVLWGAIFLVIGAGKIITLNFYSRLRLVRAIMAFSWVYTMFIGLGTCQPFLEGSGSLQLPIVYVGIAGVLLVLLFEPFYNLWTDRR